MGCRPLVAVCLLWLFTHTCLAEDRSIEGVWKFQPGDNLAWANSEWDDSNWAETTLPGIWKPGGFPEHNQFGWYRKSVNVSGLPINDLGIRMGAVRNAYQIYAGGKLLGGIGALPPDELINYDQLRVYRIPAGLVSQDQHITIAIRVWGGSQLSVDSSGAGPYSGKFEIGNYTNFIRNIDAEELPELIFASLFILTGFYFLYLYAKTGAITSFPWFGLTSLVLAVYILTLSQWRYSFGLPFTTIEKIESVSLFLFLSTSIQLIWSVVSQQVPWYMRGYQAFFVVFALIFALTPGLDIHYHLRIYWQLCALTLVVPVVWVIVRETLGGNSDARILLYGLAILISCAINDLLINMNLLNSIRLMPIGFLAILISMAVSLAGRFNTLLVSLEYQVSARTAELRQVNEQLEAANRSLVEMTRIDPLTGLLNRRGLISEAETERQRFLRQKEPLGLMITDIDHFKKFNDDNGHACGDFVLTEVAELFKDFIRDIDRVARWGGEEFVLLFPGTDAAGLANIAEKLRKKVEARNLSYEGKNLHITMTFGGAVYRDSETLDECLERADAALYRGKAAGRNRTEISR